MATLTSTGINCSNGTLDGYYTGSAASNTSFPIGSYLSVMGPTMAIATSYSVNITNAANYYFFTTGYNPIGGTPSAVPGTWRARGYSGYDSNLGNYLNLMQRTA